MAQQAPPPSGTEQKAVSNPAVIDNIYRQQRNELDQGCVAEMVPIDGISKIGRASCRERV